MANHQNIQETKGRIPAQPRRTVLAIGEALIDFVPEEKGLLLKDVPSFRRAAGGAPCNVAAALARLGIHAVLLSKVGADAFGDYLIDSFRACGIDTRYILRDSDGETPLAFVSLQKDGNRQFSFYRKNSADLHYSPSDLPAGITETAAVVHFGSVDLVPSPMRSAHCRLLEQADHSGCLISFDPNLRFALWNNDALLRETVLSFLPRAHLVKLSDEELFFLTGVHEIETALPKLLTGRTECVLYTRGAHGASVYTKSQSVTRPGRHIAVRDTTGAGDAFLGAFLACLMEDSISSPGALAALSADKLSAYTDFSNLYAACTASREGALPAMATHEELEQFSKQLTAEAESAPEVH